jgi:hypothetical protein
MCQKSWTLDDDTCTDLQLRTFNGCGMAKPCDGASDKTGRSKYTSWCYVDLATCPDFDDSEQDGSSWDFCIPYASPVDNTERTVEAMATSTSTSMASASVAEADKDFMDTTGATVLFVMLGLVLIFGIGGAVLVVLNKRSQAPAYVYAEPEHNSFGGVLTKDHLSKSLLDEAEETDVLTGIELGHQPVNDDNMPDYDEQMVTAAGLPNDYSESTI